MKLGLRERKRSQKKIEVFQAFTQRLMADEHFSEIAIKEICSEVEISEATFYNYFPHKKDLYHFMVKLWQLKLFKDVISNSGDKRGIAFIKELIFKIVEAMRVRNEIMLEFVKDLPKSEEELLKTIPTDYEIELAYPEEYETIISMKDQTIIHHFTKHLMISVEMGEIPKDTDLKMVGLSLISILVGGPMITNNLAPELTKSLIKFNIEVFLKGLQK